MAWGRKPGCTCGTCATCVRRDAARRRYRSLSIEDRRAIIVARDRERIKADDRARHERNKTNPEYVIKRAARDIVNRAIRAGKLTRGSCERCGADETHAHHDDYLKPLEVRWLCTVCHALEHVENGEAAAR